MKRLLIIVLASSLTGCGAPKQEKTSGDDAVASQHNTLSEAQRGEGWRLLFDGTTMKGWRFFGNKENDSWEVADGTLQCKPFRDDETNKRSDLITEEQFGDFELAFDWKISPQGNSGVMFRVTEEFDHAYESGPEYQIVDDEGYPGDLQPGQLTGSNYDMHVVAENRTVNPPGEWNSGRIVVRGSLVQHWLNGSKVVEYDLGSEEWNTMKMNSKWKDFPGYGLAEKGHIDLQDHGNEVWFRNVMIKTL
jgi:hypothetical protein